jgi:hypothetical protein
MSSLISIENLNIGISENLTTENVNPFKSIGIGKPLLVRFHTLYPGILEGGLLSGGKKSILITSMIKDDITSKIPPKGVHQIFRDVKSGKTLYSNAASEGTEVIYYTRALDSLLKFSIEVKLDKFNPKALNEISDLLGKASGLPLFAAHMPYLLLGSKLISVGGNLLDKIISKDTLLTYHFNISDDIAGLADSRSGWYIGINDESKGDFAGCRVVTNADGKAYLEQQGKEYSGPYPYILCSIDGLKNQRYDKFKVSMATSSVLREFYGDEPESISDTLNDIVSLYNDYEYVKKVRETRKLLESTTDEAERKILMDQLEAFRANITNEDIKKVLGS